jgi:hypothetical protein
MGSLLGVDLITARPVVVARALGAATLVLITRGATIRRRPARDELRGRPRRSAAASATLKATCRCGDLTHADHAELSQRLWGR